MFCLFSLGKFLALILPRGLCYALARFLAVTQFYCSKKDRAAVIYNLSVAAENKEKIKGYAKEVFINFAYYLVDFFRYAKLNADFIKKYVKVDGIDNLDTFLKQKKGVLAVTAHLGNYELAGAVTSLLGYKVSAIALPHKNKQLNNFFNMQRKLVGINVLPTNMAVKKCFSLLRRGELVAFLGDRDFFGGGLAIEMFSRQAILPRGPAFFALKTGAVFIPAFFVRENKKFYRLIFERPISSGSAGLRTEEEVLTRYAGILEQYIKKYPGQWYMFEKYWLTEEVESRE
jgi:KDO2-lipid IV(A) lauroyltransferase